MEFEDLDIIVNNELKVESESERDLHIAFLLFSVNPPHSLLAELMHQIDRGGHVFHRCIGKNPVSEIENVIGTPPCALKDIFDATLYLMLRCKEDHGIEIALDRHVMSDGRPRVIYLNAPIYTKHIRTGIVPERQEHSRAGSKVNQRNPFAL